MPFLPVIIFTWASMLIFFIPISFIKGIVYRRDLATSKRESFLGGALATAISFFISSVVVFIPYLILSMLVSMFLIQNVSGFFDSHSLVLQITRGIFGGVLLYHSSGLTMGIANVLMLVMCFFMHVKIETKVLKKLFKIQDTDLLIIAVKKGNLYTYPFLLLGIVLIVSAF